ncbi:hypothetical protein EDC96DRAFT_549936 [Choanephora cucurbitarum]|nr:hypothetical protein EDC96DRAFT_549936 [Choanephora cucurbitarum]
MMNSVLLDVEVALFKPDRTKVVIALQLSLIGMDKPLFKMYFINHIFSEITNLYERVYFFGLPSHHVVDIPMGSHAFLLIDPFMPIPIGLCCCIFEILLSET